MFLECRDIESICLKSLSGEVEMWGVKVYLNCEGMERKGVFEV